MSKFYVVRIKPDDTIGYDTAYVGQFSKLHEATVAARAIEAACAANHGIDVDCYVEDVYVTDVDGAANLVIGLL